MHNLFKGVAMSTEERTLPLFPLGVVLFPGTNIPLRVFYERYKTMIADIKGTDSKFGVVLIKEGLEVGTPAVPHTIGTVAQIMEANYQPNGRISVKAVGQQRFRVREIISHRPYLLANVELLPLETEEGVSQDVVRRVQQAYAEVMRALIGVTGGWIQEVDVSYQAHSLSYLIADTVTSSSKVRQYLLEIDTVEERLIVEEELLHQALVKLKERMELDGPARSFSSN